MMLRKAVRFALCLTLPACAADVADSNPESEIEERNASLSAPVNFLVVYKLESVPDVEQQACPVWEPRESPNSKRFRMQHARLHVSRRDTLMRRRQRGPCAQRCPFAVPP